MANNGPDLYIHQHKDSQQQFIDHLKIMIKRYHELNRFGSEEDTRNLLIENEDRRFVLIELMNNRDHGTECTVESLNKPTDPSYRP